MDEDETRFNEPPSNSDQEPDEFVDDDGRVVAPNSNTYVRPAGPWDHNGKKPESCDLECGDRFFKGQPRCRHNRTPEESLRHIGRER